MGSGWGDGSVIPAYDMLVAIGSLPNTEWLDSSGLTLNKGLVRDELSTPAPAPGVYGAGDVARWYNPLFSTRMRIEHRPNAAEPGMSGARNPLDPQARRRARLCRTSGPTVRRSDLRRAARSVRDAGPRLCEAPAPPRQVIVLGASIMSPDDRW